MGLFINHINSNHYGYKKNISKGEENTGEVKVSVSALYVQL